MSIVHPFKVLRSVPRRTFFLIQKDFVIISFSFIFTIFILYRRLKVLTSKREIVRANLAEIAQAKKERMEAKLRKAEEKRKELLDLRIRKAHEEDEKVSHRVDIEA